MKLRRKVPRIPARGTLAGQLIDTTLDSELAKYYLECYLQGRRSVPELDRIINQIHAANNDSLPSREYLKHLSQHLSPDFAALHLAKKIVEDKANISFYSMYKELSSAQIAMRTENHRVHDNFRSFIVLFVPGWVYESEPASGADFSKPRGIISKYGLENALIRIAETGTIEENADYIAKELVRFNGLNKKMILVSASSGGASTGLALGKLMNPRHLKNLKAWVNIGGLLQGSFLADAAIRWPKRWMTKISLFLRGWNFDSVESMTTKKSRERFEQLKLPKEIFCVNCVGIPLSGNVTARARDSYLRLRAEGPNDGITLITDALMPHSITVPMLGADHYHLDMHMELKTVALAQTVIHYQDPRPG